MRPTEEIAAALDRRIAQGGYVGVAVGLWRRDHGEFICRGVTDQTTSAPLDSDSLFEIGSLTKALTGALLALMQETGALSLDEPVGRFLGAHIGLSPAFSDQVTVLDLATHCSGLPQMPPELAGIDLDGPHPDYPLPALEKFLSSFCPQGERRYGYSNFGYGILGLCLSARAGKPFDVLLTEQVLRPLGMTATRFTPPEDNDVVGHSAERTARPAWHIPATLHGAGGLRASVRDLLRFAAACLEPPDGALGRALAQSLQPRRHSWGSRDIGLGWETDYRYPPDSIIAKGGLTSGFSTDCLLVPARREAVVVLANSMQCLSDLSHYALDQRFGLHPEPCWEPAFLASPLWYGTMDNPTRVSQ